MKLETTLPERPGFLHVLPVLNLFALLLMFFLLGPSMVLRSGLAVDLPPSRFQMERFEESVVVTLAPGEDAPRIFLGRDELSMPELTEKIEELRQTGASAKAVVLLQTDAATPAGWERAVSEMILGKGFRLALVGRTVEEPETQQPLER